MTEMDGSSKPPQISEMFQKFALAFKAKTFELFADEEAEDADGFSLLDSAEEVITNQKVVVIRPDHAQDFSLPQSTERKSISNETLQRKTKELVKTRSLEKTQSRPINAQLTHTLISSILATISSFEASYLQLQTSHVPFVEESVKVADRALVSHLQSLSELKHFYADCCKNPEFDINLPIGSCLEAQVQENQSKLRILGTVSNRLQSEIDQKHNEVLALKKQSDELQNCNSKLAKRLSGNLTFSGEILLSVSVFDSVLRDACRLAHRFTKILIKLMMEAGWDLDLAANLVHPNIEYAKKSHNRYALLSYVCLGMFRGFNSKYFGVGENESLCNGHVLDSDKRSSSLKQLLEHVSSNPMELLSMDQNCEFSKFCESKYQEIIHPTVESSIFSNLDQKEAVLHSWKSLSVFYESFVNTASAVWTLHKLAYSFDPVVEIFQVEAGIDFSMVYMEDVTKKLSMPSKSKVKVGFTVVPGFKIGRTVIQSQVYLNEINCTEH